MLTPLLVLRLLLSLHALEENIPHKYFPCSRLTEWEQAELCGLLQLTLAPGESISTIYFPIMGDGTSSLWIYVRGVTSQEDFLSRLHAQTEPLEAEPCRVFGIAYDFCERTLVFIGYSVCFQLDLLSARSPALLHALKTLYGPTDSILLFISTHYSELFIRPLAKLAYLW